MSVHKPRMDLDMCNVTKKNPAMYVLYTYMYNPRWGHRLNEHFSPKTNIWKYTYLPKIHGRVYGIKKLSNTTLVYLNAYVP